MLGCRRYPVRLFIQKWLKFRLEIHQPTVLPGGPADAVIYRIDARVSRLSGYSPCLCPTDAMIEGNRERAERELWVKDEVVS